MYSLRNVRKKFLDFFQSKNHLIIPTFSIIPENDPTLLFVNSGMAPLKRYFMKEDTPPYINLANSQLCMRVGGKHNDLSDVGYTKRHHTFFEMLGNFSFGNYFQKEIIPIAWEFLTQELKLPKERLYITVHPDDIDAFDIWEKIVGAHAITKLAENLWTMGDVGPFGYCSEIFFDLQVGNGDLSSGDRYLEIWNLVFMKFYSDGKNKSVLPSPCIDAGMGLERMASVLEGVNDTYDISFFKNALRILGKAEHTVDTKIFLDHLRACAFMISHGLTPGANSREYILRRIMRRALKAFSALTHLNLTNVDLINANSKDYNLESQNLANSINETRAHINYDKTEKYEKSDLDNNDINNRKELNNGYVGPDESATRENTSPENTTYHINADTLHYVIRTILQQWQKEYDYQLDIEKTCKIFEKERLQFSNMLEHGMKIFEELFSKNKHFDAHTLFFLHDTHGLSADITYDLLKNKGGSADIAGFEKLLEENRAQSRKKTLDTFLPFEPTEYIDDYHSQDFIENVNVIGFHEDCIILDRTPFYAQGGGQVGDIGEITGAIESDHWKVKITDTKKISKVYLHKFEVISGTPKIGAAKAKIDNQRRLALRAHHSATHLMHQAIQNHFGLNATQLGSLVEPDRLRLDFGCHQNITEQDITAIENMVNQWIRENHTTVIEHMELQKAKQLGAQAHFEYGQNVRTIAFGDRSFELCGGSHVKATGDIGIFKIIKVSSISAGTKRIVAVCGEAALKHIQKLTSQLKQIAAALNVNEESILQKIAMLQKTLTEQNNAEKNADEKDITNFKIEIENIDNFIIGYIFGDNIQIEQEMKKHKLDILCIGTQNYDTENDGIENNKTKNDAQLKLQLKIGAKAEEKAAEKAAAKANQQEKNKIEAELSKSTLDAKKVIQELGNILFSSWGFAVNSTGNSRFAQLIGPKNIKNYQETLNKEILNKLCEIISEIIKS